MAPKNKDVDVQKRDTDIDAESTKSEYTSDGEVRGDTGGKNKNKDKHLLEILGDNTDDETLDHQQPSDEIINRRTNTVSDHDNAPDSDHSETDIEGNERRERNGNENVEKSNRKQTDEKQALFSPRPPSTRPQSRQQKDSSPSTPRPVSRGSQKSRFSQQRRGSPSPSSSRPGSRTEAMRRNKSADGAHRKDRGLWILEYQRKCKSAAAEKKKSKNRPKSRRTVANTPRRDDPERRDRIFQLAQPKQSKQIWVTSSGPRVLWGTQEMLWPVSDRALKVEPSPRLSELSTPKKNFQRGDNVPRDEFYYSAGRSSCIWDVSPAAKSADASARVGTLARHKDTPEGFEADRQHFVFSCGRASPIWKVSDAAKMCPEHKRLLMLSRPKTTHQEYQPNRPDPMSRIPPAALSAKPTDRLETLSSPKNRNDAAFREPLWPVPPAALKASPTNRMQELAKPKGVSDGYQPAREVVWDVSRSARRAVPSNRIGELARPIVRATLDNIQ